MTVVRVSSSARREAISAKGANLVPSKAGATISRIVSRLSFRGRSAGQLPQVTRFASSTTPTWMDRADNVGGLSAPVAAALVVLSPGIARIEVMKGSGVMTGKAGNYNRNILFGCVALALIIAVVLIGLAGMLAWQDRQAARYPGSLPIASHSIYRGLPNEYRWHDTYLTTDDFTTVYNWYSITFELGAEAHAMEKCTILEGNNPRLILDRYVSVSVCNTPDGQMIFVSRTTSLR